MLEFHWHKGCHLILNLILAELFIPLPFDSDMLAPFNPIILDRFRVKTLPKIKTPWAAKLATT